MYLVVNSKGYLVAKFAEEINATEYVVLMGDVMLRIVDEDKILEPLGTVYV